MHIINDCKEVHLSSNLVTEVSPKVELSIFTNHMTAFNDDATAWGEVPNRLLCKRCSCCRNLKTVGLLETNYIIMVL